MKKISKAFILLITGLMFITPVTAKDNPVKEEIVYSKMNFDGSVDSIFVVNAFELKKQTTIVDYAPYSSVVNTTTNHEIQSNGKKITIKDVAEGRFFYQGTLSASTQLPWLIDINYYLDNQSISAKDLGGKSGHLKIELKSKQNKNINDVYFNNYLLSVTFNINSKLISNLKAEDATIGNAGEDKTIVFTGMPKSEAHFIVEADVKDFEMDAIQIAALPFSMAIEMPDLGDFVSGLTDLSAGVGLLNSGANQLASGLNQLNSNTTQLVDGANSLASGSNQLSSAANSTAQGTQEYTLGVSQYASGVTALSLGSKELVDGSAQIKEGINLLSSGLLEFGSMITITPEQQVLIDSIVILINQLKDFIENDLGSAVFLPFAQALKRETVLALFPQLDLNDPNTLLLIEYMELQAKLIEESFNLLEPYQELIKTELLPQLEKAITILQSIGQIPEMIEGVQELNSSYELFHNGLTSLSDGLSQLDENSGQLVSGGEQLSQGINQFKDGLNEFNSGVQQYSSGISQATDGISQLADGANQLSSGTGELNDATSDIGPLMEETIAELMKDYEFEDFDMVSFVDERNENVELVQFVYMTQTIQKPKVQEEVITEEKTKSFWDLFLDLFR